MLFVYLLIGTTLGNFLLSKGQTLANTDQVLSLEQCPSFRDQPSGSTATFNGKCYIFYQDKALTFDNAWRFCDLRGGSLVNEASASLYRFIGWEVYRRHKSDKNGQYWLGAFKDSTSSKWKWFNGKQLTQLSSKPGQGKGICSRFDGTKGRMWVETNCNAKLHFVCQHRPTTTKTTTTSTTLPPATTTSSTTTTIATTTTTTITPPPTKTTTTTTTTTCTAKTTPDIVSTRPGDNRTITTPVDPTSTAIPETTRETTSSDSSSSTTINNNSSEKPIAIVRDREQNRENEIASNATKSNVNATATTKLNLSGIIAFGVFGGFVFLAAIITITLLIARRLRNSRNSIDALTISTFDSSGDQNGFYRNYKESWENLKYVRHANSFKPSLSRLDAFDTLYGRAVIPPRGLFNDGYRNTNEITLNANVTALYLEPEKSPHGVGGSTGHQHHNHQQRS